MAYMNYRGWQQSTRRDDKRKLHTDLVPFEELSEDIKQYDREAVKIIPGLPGYLGLTLEKKQQNQYNNKF